MSAAAILARLPQTSIHLGLERIQRACAALGDPQGRFPSILIGGSNGKGSTAAFCSAALQAQGLRVGLYTSPHLISFRERIQVDGAWVTEAALDAAMARINASCPSALETGHPDALSYFEVATLLACLVFAEAQVDVAVLEVGLGGRLDATNLQGKQLVATALSPISLDHREWLGESLEAIAAEKVAIARAGVPLVVAPQEEAALRSVRAASDAIGSPRVEVGKEVHAIREEEEAASRAPAGGRAGEGSQAPSERRQTFTYQGSRWLLQGLRPGLLGPHQIQNATTALALLEGLPEPLRISPEAARTGIEVAQWPGRIQLIPGDPSLILDGAHNAQAAEALASSLAALWPGLRPALVFGVLDDKEREPILRELLPLASSLHLCAPPSPRAVPAEQLLEELQPSLGAGAFAACYPTPEAAVEAARQHAGPGGAVLVAGSLYLVGAVLEWLHAKGEPPV